MSRVAKLVALVIVLPAIAAVAWFLLRGGEPTAFASGKRVDLADFNGANPTGVPASLAQADLVARGEYLARAADCAACHTAPGVKPFAGRPPFQTRHDRHFIFDQPNARQGHGHRCLE
jgi:mono/diheme cytochrome c family protein